jgi:glycosyltransferase involved in cell wall biosynthesis
MISVFVITQNESRRILECLRSIAWADEIIVVDSGSTDSTLDIARSFGARCIIRPWTGFSDQRNFAIQQCAGDWLLYLDADEQVSHDFETEARRIESVHGGECDAYWVRSREFFMGEFLEYGGFGLNQPNKKLRFWKKGAGRFDGLVHERLSVKGPTGTMNAHVDHFSTASTISGLLTKLNKYSSLEVNRRENTSQWMAVLNMFAQPLRVFISRFFRYQGYRDGLRGTIIIVCLAFYEFLVYAKIVEATNVPKPRIHE